MTGRRSGSTVRRGLLACAAMLCAACAPLPPAGTAGGDVSSVPLAAGPAIQRVAPLPRVEIDYGEGDCGPRFSNGMRGTCINKQPCNGFGFKDAAGKLECACFDTKGGCPDTHVCSLRARACVAPSEADFKRLPTP